MTETAWAQGTRLAEAGISFATPDLLAQLDSMTQTALDALDFGVVKVDDRGTVLLTNRYEAEFSGVPSEQAVGKNWFFDIAPCTNNRLFLGTFRKGVAEGQMNLYFFYAFTFKMAPTEVRVHLYRSPSGSNWILLKRK
jgi:photoactive yellow protein